MGLDHAGSEEQGAVIPGPLKSHREASLLSLGYVSCAWYKLGICHQLEPWVSGVVWRKGEAETSSRGATVPLLRGAMAAQGGGIRAVGLGPVVTSQLWPGDLVRASNCRYLVT